MSVNLQTWKFTKIRRVWIAFFRAYRRTDGRRKDERAWKICYRTATKKSSCYVL